MPKCDCWNCELRAEYRLLNAKVTGGDKLCAAHAVAYLLRPKYQLEKLLTTS